MSKHSTVRIQTVVVGENPHYTNYPHLIIPTLGLRSDPPPCAPAFPAPAPGSPDPTARPASYLFYTHCESTKAKSYTTAGPTPAHRVRRGNASPSSFAQRRDRRIKSRHFGRAPRVTVAPPLLAVDPPHAA